MEDLGRLGFKVGEGGRIYATVNKERIRDLLAEIRLMDPLFVSLTATDYPDINKIELTYAFWSFKHKALMVIKTYVDRNSPKIDSISDLFPGATYSELEAYDLMGVEFNGNPILRRGAFVPQELVSESVYPLRKDSGV